MGPAAGQGEQSALSTSTASASSNQCLVIRVPADGKVGLAVEVRLKKEPKGKIAEDT